MMENSTTISDRLHIDSFTISAPSDTDDPTTGQDIPSSTPPRRDTDSGIGGTENLLPIAIVVETPTAIRRRPVRNPITSRSPKAFMAEPLVPLTVDQTIPEIAQETASEVYLINIPAIQV